MQICYYVLHTRIFNDDVYAVHKYEEFFGKVLFELGGGIETYAGNCLDHDFLSLVHLQY